MCGKFTTKANWAEIVSFSESLTSDEGGESITLRVMSSLPVIVLDPATMTRRIMPMRWGFPHRINPNRPDPIHARAETIDEKPTFRDAFYNGQRGIVLARTFNEGRELETGRTQQHVITPGDDGAVGMAFIWRSFDRGTPIPLLACVLVTVPASGLIGTITDRMPAILEPKDWAKWLGQEMATMAELKACLKTREEPNWSMSPEDAPRRAPTPSNPQGFL
jgi:putative SOS response-associated peptidase YedK